MFRRTIPHIDIAQLIPIPYMVVLTNCLLFCIFITVSEDDSGTAEVQPDGE